MAGQRQRRGHLPAISVDVVGIQRAQSGRGGRRDRGECTEQGVGVMVAVTLDEFRVVEVVAGVEPDARGQGGAQLLLVIGGEQRDLHPVDLRAVLADQIEERTRSRSVSSSRPPVPAQLRVEHLAQPVQDHRSSRLSQHARVDLKVVLGAASDGRQLAGGHHDRLRARRLDELDLLEIGAGDLAEAAGRGDKLIGAGAGGDPGAVLAGRAPRCA